MASGEIILAGILQSRRSGRLKLHRLQMLVVTLVFAIGYLIVGLSHAGGSTLPNIPKLMLLALLGSQGAYLTGKYKGG